MKKKGIKKENITIEYIAELVTANSAHIERLTGTVETISADVKQNSIDIKMLSVKVDSEIDELAVLTQRGFDSLEEKFETRLREEIGGVTHELKEMNTRLEIMEGVKYHTHSTRLDNLEDSMLTVKTKLGVK